jgi:hypothetical protein
MMTRKESTSFMVCGVLTVSHFESSKATSCAPTMSPFVNLQFALKLYVVRAVAGVANFVPTAGGGGGGNGAGAGSAAGGGGRRARGCAGA